MIDAIRFHRTGGPDVLRVDRIDVRPPRENEVRIRVEAVGLNRSDSIYYHGHHPVQPVLPSLLGQEAAGRAISQPSIMIMGTLAVVQTI